MNMRLNNFQAKRYEVDLVIDTSQYASGDVLSDRVAVELVSEDTAEALGVIRGEILGAVLLDKDDEGGALDLVFLDADVSLGTVNNAVSITDTNAERVLGIVPVTSYEDLGGCKLARPDFAPIYFEVAEGKLYVGAISKDTKTYTAAPDLRVKLFVRLHNVDL